MKFRASKLAAVERNLKDKGTNLVGKMAQEKKGVGIRTQKGGIGQSGELRGKRWWWWWMTWHVREKGRHTWQFVAPLSYFFSEAMSHVTHYLFLVPHHPPLCQPSLSFSPCPALFPHLHSLESECLLLACLLSFFPCPDLSLCLCSPGSECLSPTNFLS